MRLQDQHRMALVLLLCCAAVVPLADKGAVESEQPHAACHRVGFWRSIVLAAAFVLSIAADDTVAGVAAKRAAAAVALCTASCAGAWQRFCWV
jgi:anti-sigma-K factor RskA